MLTLVLGLMMSVATVGGAPMGTTTHASADCTSCCKTDGCCKSNCCGDQCCSGCPDCCTKCGNAPCGK